MVLVKASHIRAMLDPHTELIFCKNELCSSIETLNIAHVDVSIGKVLGLKHFPVPITVFILELAGAKAGFVWNGFAMLCSESTPHWDPNHGSQQLGVE